MLAILRPITALWYLLAVIPTLLVGVLYYLSLALVAIASIALTGSRRWAKNLNQLVNQLLVAWGQRIYPDGLPVATDRSYQQNILSSLFVIIGEGPWELVERRLKSYEASICMLNKNEC